MDTGTCQFCVFPYKDPFFAQDMKHDCSYNLYFGQFYCPVVVNKITNEPLNHMLVMACPDKESWEEQPTCFIPETSPETSDSNDTKPTTPKSEGMVHFAIVKFFQLQFRVRFQMKCPSALGNYGERTHIAELVITFPTALKLNATLTIMEHAAAQNSKIIYVF